MTDLDLDFQATLDTFRLDVKLRVERGPVALVGPNGAGKSTVLRALAGAVKGRGSLRVRGRELADQPPERRRVGYMPQGSGLFEHLSVLGNVGYGIAAEHRRERALEGLAAAGVAHLAERRPKRLSGGERQRVALARALAAEPELLLLDEATSALDVTVRPAIRALLEPSLHRRDLCALLVTHDLRDLLAWRPTVALMEAGRVIEQGTVEELKSSPHPFLRELLSPA